jgi:energy-coupling factor transporter ATP-binding protein EcfA2
MLIGNLRICNFRSHRDTSIRLFPITVLVGHGSSGKSNLFDALVNLSVVLRGRIGNAFSPYPWGTFASAKSWGTNPVAPIKFEVEVFPKKLSDPPFNYEFHYKQASGGDEPIFQITKEALRRGDSSLFDRENPDECKIPGVDYIDDDRSIFAALRVAKTSEADLGELARGISRIGKYRLEPNLLSRPSNLPPPSTEAAPQTSNMWLDYRGENLAAVLYQLEETDKSKIASITDAVKSVFPEFEGFSFNFIGEGKVGFSAKFSVHQEPVLAPLLSHGMLLFIGLMTLLHTPSSPDVILLEEPENGLDAKALKAFYAKLVEIIGDGTGGRQVLLSSHSPYVLCEAWNGPSRNFVYHITEANGRSNVSPVTAVMATFGGTLQTDGTMSIRLAERIMSERWQAGE